MKIAIEIVGTEGNPRTETVEVAPSGATVKEVCAAAGIDVKNKDFTVNGEPATPDTHVSPSDVMAAKTKAQAPVSVSPRPQGS